MNFYSDNVKSKNTKQRNNSKSIRAISLLFVFSVFVVLLLMFSAMVYFVTARAKAELANKKIQDLKAEISGFDADLKHLRMKKEELSSWKKISQKIRLYQMPLIAPGPGQVRDLYQYTGRDTSSKESNAAVAFQF